MLEDIDLAALAQMGFSFLVSAYLLMKVNTTLEKNTLALQQLSDAIGGKPPKVAV